MQSGSGQKLYEGSREISRDEILTHLKEYSPVLRFIDDWQSGRFTMTLTEYNALPMGLTWAVRVVERFKHSLKKE